MRHILPGANELKAWFQQIPEPRYKFRRGSAVPIGMEQQERGSSSGGGSHVPDVSMPILHRNRVQTASVEDCAKRPPGRNLLADIQRLESESRHGGVLAARSLDGRRRYVDADHLVTGASQPRGQLPGPAPTSRTVSSGANQWLSHAWRSSCGIEVMRHQGSSSDTSLHARCHQSRPRPRCDDESATPVQRAAISS